MSIRTDERHALTAVDVFFDHKGIVSGAALPSVEIPAQAVLLGGFMVVDETFDAVTHLDIGDSDNPTRYAAGIDPGASGKKPMTFNGHLAAKDNRLLLTFLGGTLGAKPTQGKARIHLYYSQTNRADFTQG